MGDVVTCTAVLCRSKDPRRIHHLLLSPKPGDYRNVPCRPATSKPSDFDDEEDYRTCWIYSEKDGRLHITPSLHCTDTGFHTDYAWNVAFQLLPEGESSMSFFDEINPDFRVKPS